MLHDTQQIDIREVTKEAVELIMATETTMQGTERSDSADISIRVFSAQCCHLFYSTLFHSVLPYFAFIRSVLFDIPLLCFTPHFASPSSPTLLPFSLSHFLLRYTILCYDMLCYAMLCNAMLCYAMLCYAEIFPVLSSSVITSTLLSVSMIA